MYQAPAWMAGRTAWGEAPFSCRTREASAQVAGMNCAKPRAPEELTAFGSSRLS